MTMSRPDTVTSPLTVKEQFEASATRFWSSVRNLNAEDSTKNAAAAATEQEEAMMKKEPQSLTDDTTAAANNQVSFQSVIHAVFGSCTTGMPYEGYSSKHSRSTRTTISPTCSREGGGASTADFYSSTRSSRILDTSESNTVEKTFSESQHTKKSTAVESSSRSPPRSGALKPKFFQDNRQLAEEAVLHLREQQLQQNLDLRQQHQQNQRQKEYEKVVASRGAASTKAASMQDCSNKTATPPSPTNLNNKKEPLSFFPVSKPSSGRDPPGTHHAASRKAPVPKVVSSPPRRGLTGKASGIPAVATTYPSTTEANDDDIFDFADDGISVITQETVDRMVRDMEEQQKDFPNDFLLNRVYSDSTDPVDRSFRHWEDGKFETIQGNVGNAAEGPQASPQEGRYMTPPRLTRQNRSSETRSFFTKTTHSTDPEDFNAWKKEEQQYWDSLVAKEESTATTATDVFGTTRTSKNSGSDVKRRDGGGNSRSIPPSPRSTKLKRVREKVKRNVVRLNAASVTSSSNNNASEMNPAGKSVDSKHLSNHDRQMDVMILQSDVGMAEI